MTNPTLNTLTLTDTIGSSGTLTIDTPTDTDTLTASLCAWYLQGSEACAPHSVTGMLARLGAALSASQRDDEAATWLGLTIEPADDDLDDDVKNTWAVDALCEKWGLDSACIVQRATAMQVAYTLTATNNYAARALVAFRDLLDARPTVVALLTMLGIPTDDADDEDMRAHTHALRGIADYYHQRASLVPAPSAPYIDAAWNLARP